ncbi:Transcriptional regulator MraZ [uncultured archaeon]|nr:Transcriptional regulator MraZ [uncultured archaeon]
MLDNKYIGVYHVTVDPKGRINLPKKFRRNGVNIYYSRPSPSVKGFLLYPEPTFEEIVEGLENLPEDDPIRVSFAESREIKVDSASRMNIARLDLGDRVTMLGNLNCLILRKAEKKKE